MHDHSKTNLTWQRNLHEICAVSYTMYSLYSSEESSTPVGLGAPSGTAAYQLCASGSQGGPQPRSERRASKPPGAGRYNYAANHPVATAQAQRAVCTSGLGSATVAAGPAQTSVNVCSVGGDLTGLPPLRNPPRGVRRSQYGIAL